MASMESKPRTPPRKWFRYSPRSLLLFVALCAAGAHFCGAPVAAYYAEQAALRELSALGADIYVEGGMPDCR